jgi:ribosomal protein S18 acetylase RimI-like enzyme
MPDPLVIRPFHEADRAALVALWRRCELTRPWNDPDRDIDRKLAADADLLLVAQLAEPADDREGLLVGAVMAGYDGHRGSINYLAVDPAHQGTGHGRRLVRACEARLEAMGCPKVNLQVRATNAGVVEFYRSLGYDVDDVVSLGKRLIADG